MPGQKDTAAEVITSSSALEEAVTQVGVLLEGMPGRLSRLRVARGEATIEVEWQPHPASFGPPPWVEAEHAGPVATEAYPVRAAECPVETRCGIPEGEAICSPLVGTFYRAPEPGAPPFVSVGDVVEEGEQVAIVEAMKLMNTIIAPVSGRVVHVGAEDGEGVEYDQVLFVIDTGQE